MSHEDITIQITQQFIDAIEKGMVNGKWERPWTLNGTFPTNVVTGKDYRGMNALLLMMMSGGHYAGYGQWKKIGAQVRKGEKCILILAPKMRKTGNVLPNGDDEKVPKGYKVARIFAASQVDGYTIPAPIVHDTTPIEAAAMVASKSGATITYGSDRACFVPSADIIRMPDVTQFADAVDFHSVELHELVHWTGHTSRLDRKLNTNRFGDEAYAFEELIAELGASFLCAELGIRQGFQENHARYLKSWLKALKNDSKAIMTAASGGAMAADVLMGRCDMQGKAIIKVKEGEAVAA